MGVRKATTLIFEPLKPGLLFMWGSAAWAQTQLTPGVSVHAAPRSSIRLKVERMADQIRGRYVS